MRPHLPKQPIPLLRPQQSRALLNRLPPHPSTSPFSTLLPPPTTQALVPVGWNGSISLTIHHPPRPSALCPILIHLPRGPLLPPTTSPPSLSPLALSANATVVSVEYRLSPFSHPYPTPIHDVATGYDWVVKHLVRGSAAHNGWQSARARSAPVAVCGELIGGSLGAMLALTECHASKHGGVRALVLGSPVVDWTAMYAIDSSNADDAAPPADKDPSTAATRAKSRRKKPPPADSWRTHDCGLLLPASALLLARAALFATPEHYHDPFASPLLFFRSASSAIPQPPAASALFNHFLPSAPAASPAAVTAFLKPRRAHLRYPPLGSALVLPRSRIDVGRHSVLRDQGVELAEAMGRSWALYGGRGAGGKAGVEMAEGGEEGAGVENVEVWEGEGEGLWGEEQLVSVGRWVAETLGPGA